MGFQNKLDKIKISIKLLFAKSEDFGSLRIFGDKEFKNLTIKILSLIKEKTMEDYKFIAKYIKYICQFNKSGVYTYTWPALCTIKKESAMSSDMWYAGTLAHEAYHVYLYKNFKDACPHSNGVPSEIDSGKDAEKKCLEFESSVLKKIGADQKTINLVLAAIDTNFWEVLPKERNW